MATMTHAQSLAFIRNEIVQEFSLLNGRITWFSCCQSFLITAFSISLGNAPTYRAGWLVQFLFPILGALLCAVVLPGILGACSTIAAWRDQQHRLLQSPGAAEELAPVTIARFHEVPHLDRLHRRSLWFATSLPALLCVFWVVAFVMLRVAPLAQG